MKRTATNVVASVDNLKLANKLRLRMGQIVEDSRYSVALRQFMKTFASSGNLIRDYFATLNVGFRADKALYLAVQEANVRTTISGLLGAGMSANFIDPVTSLLEKSIAGGTTYKDLRAMLKNQIVGSEDVKGKLERYATQVADDAIHQYQRNYMEAISADLGLSHYFYAGTTIRTTRPFCRSRVGGYYTLAEVQSWASLEWAGRIAGTNSQNIRTYLGGNRCKHKLIPVSREIYEKNVKK